MRVVVSNRSGAAFVIWHARQDSGSALIVWCTAAYTHIAFADVMTLNSIRFIHAKHPIRRLLAMSEVPRLPVTMRAAWIAVSGDWIPCHDCPSGRIVDFPL